MKKILTIQDISCVGRCSLTVALPIISAMGVEACPLPTALLSTHTLFPQPSVLDLTDHIPSVTSHWQRIGVRFDGIYTGYIASIAQLDVISCVIDDFRGEDGFVFIDPVMGDHGRLYSRFTPEYVERMAAFCGKGDVIVPNLTEACLMLGMDYIGDSYTQSDIREILAGLTGLGAAKAVITGVSLEPGRLGAAALDSDSGEYFLCEGERVEGSFHGTGDIFASVCVGSLAKGKSLGTAVESAVHFTYECIRRTQSEDIDRRFGVNFESALGYLTDKIYNEKEAKQMSNHGVSESRGGKPGENQAGNPVSVVFEENADRSAAYRDGNLIGECEFEVSENVWSIVHTGVRPGNEGQGIARKLVEKVIEEASARQVRINPVCSYARKLMTGKEEYRDILAN